MIYQPRRTRQRFAWARVTSAVRFIEVEGYLTVIPGGPEVHPHERVVLRILAHFRETVEPVQVVDHTIDEILSVGSGLTPGDRAAMTLWLYAVRGRLPVDLALCWIDGGAIERDEAEPALWDSVLVTLVRTGRTVQRALVRVAEYGYPPGDEQWDRWLWR